MKKLLTILAATGLTVTTGVSAVACSKPENSSKSEIKLKIGSPTIGINETTDIIITNYSQIKNNLEDFTLNIVKQRDEEEPFLEQVGDFDAINGKFIVKGLHKGKANVVVMGYFQDKDLGKNPVTAALTVTVTTELKFVAIEAEETEFSVLFDGTTIHVKEYQQLKEKWEDFTLDIVNQDSNNQEPILKQAGDFDDKEGTFEVYGVELGNAKVTVSASLKEGAENFKTVASAQTVNENNEIIITVKKIDLQDVFEKDIDMNHVIGYGITGAKILETIEASILSSELFEYGKDYEILGIGMDDILEKNCEVKVQANKNAKFLEGSGTFKLTKLDIRILEKTLTSVPVGKIEKELKEIIEKEIEQKIPGVKYQTDWIIYDYALIVGGKVNLMSWPSSEILAGGYDLSVIGESYAQWNLEKLNNQTNEFTKTTNELIEANQGSGFDEPVKNPELKDQWINNYFAMFSFFARVFFETDYVVTGISEGEPKIEKPSDFEKAKEELQNKLTDFDQVGGDHDYYSFLRAYSLALDKLNK